MDWNAYKQAAALPFEALECEADNYCKVAVSKTIEGSHGDHRIDVWLKSKQFGIKTQWLIDCRHWNTPVSKTDVVALKQVLKDVRGDRALMLSNSGFDSGATKAARSANITLTTLEELRSTAALEVTRTTLISLETRITKVKRALERLSESVQVAPGLWQSRPKAGVDGAAIAQTAKQLEGLKFGFARARLQQPPYLIAPPEAGSKTQVAKDLDDFVAQAAALIVAAEAQARQQQQQAQQASLVAAKDSSSTIDSSSTAQAVADSAVEAHPSKATTATDGAPEKKKRSLHAAFFRRQPSVRPGPPKGTEGERGRRNNRDGNDRGVSRRGDRRDGQSSRRDGKFDRKFDRNSKRDSGPSKPGSSRASFPRPNSSRSNASPNRAGSQYSSSRPGPATPGPSRSAGAGSKPKLNPSASSKPQLRGKGPGRMPADYGNSRPRSDRDSSPSSSDFQQRSPGRSQRSSRPRFDAPRRNSSGSRFSASPVRRGGPKPGYGEQNQERGRGLSGEQRDRPSPVKRKGQSSSSYGAGQFQGKKRFKPGPSDNARPLPRKKKFGADSSGDRGRKFGERKFGERKFGEHKFGERKFGGRKFGARQPGRSHARNRVSGVISNTKPNLRRNPVSEGSKPQSEKPGF